MNASLETPVLAIDSVIQAGDYCLRLAFSDQTTQEIDFAPFLNRSVHPEVRKFLELDRFAAFRLVDGELMWGDYDLIFPIHDLYGGVI